MMARLVQIQEKNTNWLPYLYATMSSIFLVLLQICMREMSMYINPSFAIFFRCFGVMIICGVLLLLQKLTINVKQPKLFRLLIARSSLGVANFILVSVAVTVLPIAIVNSLFNLGPILIFFIEAFHSNQKIKSLQILFTSVCFIGVLLIIKPQFLFHPSSHSQSHSSSQKLKYTDYNRFFLVLPICSAIVFSYAVFLLHKIKGRIGNNVILFHLFLCQALVGGVQLNFDPANFKKQVDLRLALISFAVFPVSYFMQIFLTRATMYKPASSTMPFGYSGIVFSLVVDIVMYNGSFDWISVAGIFLTSSGLLSKLVST